MIKKCNECETDFNTKDAKVKYCSSECRRIYRNRRNRLSITPETRRKYNKTYKQKNPAKRILASVNNRDNIDIDEKWIQERLDIGYCEATGIKFESYTYNETSKSKGWSGRIPFMPSVDKIDPSKGYVKSNCRLVVWIFNLAKGTYTDDDVYKMAIGFINNKKDEK